MSDRVCLVTGAAGGIGRAIVRRMARDGRRVVFTYLSREAEARALVAELGERVEALPCDLSQPGAAEALVRDVAERMGRLDEIVSNAAGKAEGPVGGVTAAHRALIEINLTAPIAMMDAARAVLPEGGAIVAISSINATRPPAGAAAYAASKSGLDGAVRAYARDLGQLGIRVNAVAPGLIELEERPRPQEIVDKVIAETPLGRVGRPEDIAAAVAFLLSQEAGFITGEILGVSGGYQL
ncbi:MAG: SDR family oxidoreductase [Roseicyclus sp.]|nr:SDR family oxidoreductase [Roseicyclus sp.]MBO6625431.1 SDR family oxidoreductase [Roseicyclus sp.]MBO6923714.1 SDR family oxidoreductase [Roseicyclus sp.]